ncbi:MAG: hypothetical protein IJE07_13365 [Clostridia bacterium]|nr:hypothetical protein [Clostridia bacterium]
MKIRTHLSQEKEEFQVLRRLVEERFTAFEAAPEEPVEGEEPWLTEVREIAIRDQGVDHGYEPPDWPAWNLFTGEYPGDLLLSLFRLVYNRNEYVTAMLLATAYRDAMARLCRPDWPTHAMARLAQAMVHYAVGDHVKAATLAMYDDESTLDDCEICFSGLVETRELLIRRSCEAAGAWVELAEYLAERRMAVRMKPCEASERALLEEIRAAVKARGQESPLWKPSRWAPGWLDRKACVGEEAMEAAETLREMRLERGCNEDEASQGLRMLDA